MEERDREPQTLAAEKPSIVQTFLNMIPRNPVKAAADMDLLPLIVFTIYSVAAWFGYYLPLPF